MKKTNLLARFWVGVPILSALLFATLLLILFKADPVESFSSILRGAFSTQDKILSVLAFLVPLLLCSVGLLFTFTAGLWNIGIEGQMILGAIGASYIALNVDAPSYILIPLELLTAMAAGALWAAISAVLKTHGKVHEIFSGLALTNLAIILTNYLISGPWQPPEGGSFRGTQPFQDAALLPVYQNSRFSPLSLFLTALVIVVVAIMLRNTTWGLKLKALGKNPRSAFLLGVSSNREAILAMMSCGAIAGLAGSVRVLSWFDSLRQSISGGIGFLALLVVMLAVYRLILVPFIAFFFSVVLVGSVTFETTMQLKSSLGGVITGILVLFTLLFGDYKKLGISNKESSNE
jgi:simple sugar transport system permease protein